MFLLPERNVPIPLSHDEVCKAGDWGGGCCKACPNLGGSMERRGQPERRGGRNAGSHTHSSWVLLRDREEEGVTLPAAGNKTERVCCPPRLQPFLLHQFREPKNEPRGPNRESNTIYKMEKKPQHIFSFQPGMLGWRGQKCMQRGQVGPNYFFRLYVKQITCLIQISGCAYTNTHTNQ